MRVVAVEIQLEAELYLPLILPTALNGEQDKFTQKTILSFYENKNWIYMKKKSTNEVREPYFRERICCAVSVRNS
jgi:hypothetical protein